MSGSIWRVDLAGGAAGELTRGVSWSPDGRWIVYTADHDGRSVQLEILDVASGETRALTDDGRIYADPVFSSDGSRIAYAATAPNGCFNVFVRPLRYNRKLWIGA